MSKEIRHGAEQSRTNPSRTQAKSPQTKLTCSHLSKNHLLMSTTEILWLYSIVTNWCTTKCHTKKKNQGEKMCHGLNCRLEKGHSILHMPVYNGNPVNHHPSLRKLFSRQRLFPLLLWNIKLFHYNYSQSYEARATTWPFNNGISHKKIYIVRLFQC